MLLKKSVLYDTASLSRPPENWLSTNYQDENKALPFLAGVTVYLCFRYRTFWIFYRSVRQEKLEILACQAFGRLNFLRLYGSEVPFGIFDAGGRFFFASNGANDANFLSLFFYRTFWIFFYRSVRQEKLEILACVASWRLNFLHLYGSESVFICGYALPFPLFTEESKKNLEAKSSPPGFSINAGLA